MGSWLCTQRFLEASSLGSVRSVQSDFLRFVTGVSKTNKVQSMLDECNELPFLCALIEIYTNL